MLNSVLSLLRTTCAVVVIAILATVSLAGIAGFWGQFSQWCELSSHLRFLYLLACAPCLIVLLCLRFWKTYILFMAFFALNAVPVLEFYLPAPSISADDVDSHLTVLQLNVWGPKNPHHEKVVDFIRERSPDIVGISELTDSWRRDLKTGLPDYPHQLIELRHGGIALFSKTPLLNPRLLYFGPIRRPRIEATIMNEGREIELIFAHPVIPKKKYDIRNGELLEIAQNAGNSKSPVVVFGDLNCSPWSYYFRKLMDVGQLQDSERGFGFQPTWTTQWCFPWVPIDHCLTSKDFCTTERVVGPDIGSDHLPVFVKLALRRRR